MVDFSGDVEEGGDRGRERGLLGPKDLILSAHPTSTRPREFKLPSVCMDGKEHGACWRGSPLKNSIWTGHLLLRNILEKAGLFFRKQRDVEHDLSYPQGAQSSFHPCSSHQTPLLSSLTVTFRFSTESSPQGPRELQPGTFLLTLITMGQLKEVSWCCCLVEPPRHLLLPFGVLALRCSLQPF